MLKQKIRKKSDKITKTKNKKTKVGIIINIIKFTILKQLIKLCFQVNLHLNKLEKEYSKATMTVDEKNILRIRKKDGTGTLALKHRMLMANITSHFVDIIQQRWQKYLLIKGNFFFFLNVIIIIL